MYGFEKEKAKSIYLNFIHNGADIEIKEKEIHIKMLKKSHNPIIMDAELFKSETKISWLNNYKLLFSIQNTT